MLEFEKKIVHVLDCEHNTCILSEGGMKIEDDVIAKMLSSKAEKYSIVPLVKGAFFAKRVM